MTVFQAITHLAGNEADPEFVLPLLQRVALPKYTSLSSVDAGFMRKAICHLDVIWYRPTAISKVAHASAAPKAS